MIAKRFHTSPIFFDTLADLEVFVGKLADLRVDAFDFTQLDQPSDDDQDEEDFMIGDTLKLQIDRDKLEVIVSGSGGLKYYDLNKLPEDSKGLPEISDLMEDVFNFDFYCRHQDTLINVISLDINKVVMEKQVKLTDYHSKDAYEERLASKQASIMEAKQALKNLNQHLDSLKTESKKIQIALHKIKQEEQLDQAF